MGNCISLTCFDCGPTCNLNLGKEIENILCPRRLGEILNSRMEKLKGMKEDVEREMREKRGPQVQVSNEVERWVDQVGRLDGEVSEILGSSHANGLLCCCSLCSSPALGDQIRRKMKLAKELENQKNGWTVPIFVACTAPSIPESSPGNIVGIEETMSRVVDYLKNDGIGVIGIHGMGGAGKTTLINQVIRSLQSSSAEPIIKFDSIIEVVVSQKLDVRKIQDEIAKQLGIDLSRHGDGERARAGVLSAWLSRRRFLLVLDDVWEAVDLKRIVGNLNNNGCSCKVVLTTREESVCVDTGCQERVKVGCLGKEHSWELFQKTIRRDDDWFQSVVGIREIAEEMVRRCGGLPLLLITVARVMATKSDIQGWKYAKEALKDSPHDIRGMEDVYRLLEFSFNNLENEEYKSCLLYSALYPEDWSIRIEEMVDYCIGGGSIGGADSSSSSGSSDINRLRDRGAFIISELVDACLLERVERLEGCVKVHDAIRDMIVKWLGKNNWRYKILSDAGKGIEGDVEVDETWRDVSMVSLQENKMEGVKLKEDHGNSTARCCCISSSLCRGKEKVSWLNDNTQVLLLNRNEHLKKLPRSLFEYFPNLRVLDLSDTGLKQVPASLCSLKSLQYLNLSNTWLPEIPASLCSLKALRYLNLSNSWLVEIPASLCSLKSLQYLNLSDSWLVELPASLCSLKSLQYLNLSDTWLVEIPASLCSLKSLQYLNLSDTDIEALPKEMGNLTNLMQLDLSYTEYLCEIPSGVLSSLSKLQSVNLIYCYFFNSHGGKEKLEVLKEVDGLPLLKDVGLSFYEDPDAVNFLIDKSSMVSESITKLHILGVDLISNGLFQRIGLRSKKLKCLRINNFLDEDKEREIVIDEGHFMQLKTLVIESANSLQRIIILSKGQEWEQLTYLSIGQCNGQRDLTCLWQLPNLEYLSIHECNGIEEVVPRQPRGDGNESHGINYHHEPFPKLKSIHLSQLKSLVRISSGPLSLRSLNYLKILQCSSLKELSIVPSNSQNVNIYCQKVWWKDFEWADGAPPLNFKPIFLE